MKDFKNKQKTCSRSVQFAVIIAQVMIFHWVAFASQGRVDCGVLVGLGQSFQFDFEYVARGQLLFPVKPKLQLVFDGHPGSPRAPHLVEGEPGSTPNGVQHITGVSCSSWGGRGRVLKSGLFVLDETRDEGEEVCLRGYPSANIDLFGGAAAAFLGHERLSRKKWLDPDASTLNLALDFLNQRAQSPLELAHIRFYEPFIQSSTGVVDPEIYIAEFGFNGRIPKVRDGCQRLHDGCFHEGAIFLTENQVRLARAQARARIMFIYFLRSNGFETDFFAHESKARARFVNYAVTAIDSLTGSPAVYMNEKILRIVFGSSDEFGKKVFYLLGAGLSPRSLLEPYIFAWASRYSKPLIAALKEFINYMESIDLDFNYSIVREPNLTSPEGYYLQIEQDLEHRRRVMVRRMQALGYPVVQ
ncbi:MAG: hypothetical protein K1X29_04560 [Bdellovibrionales bacterium]|nr:hypothetical protein [Bdellovibrionales bacterium]